jgi:hypothetical protein
MTALRQRDTSLSHSHGHNGLELASPHSCLQKSHENPLNTSEQPTNSLTTDPHNGPIKPYKDLIGTSKEADRFLAPA